jgi:hypothetical protein
MFIPPPKAKFLSIAFNTKISILARFTWYPGKGVIAGPWLELVAARGIIVKIFGMKRKGYTEGAACADRGSFRPIFAGLLSAD